MDDKGLGLWLNIGSLILIAALVVDFYVVINAALRAFTPYVLGERFLPRQGRPKRHRCIGQGAQAEGSQARSFLRTDSPNRRRHGMNEPPFTCTVWPVTCPASSLARNTAIPAMSSGCAMRPSGTALAITPSSSSVLP